MIGAIAIEYSPIEYRPVELVPGMHCPSPGVTGGR
jgi:hypothetical protein